MLVAIADEGSNRLTNKGYQALSQVAAEDITSLNFRDSFALIGFTGKEKPSFVKQVCHKLEKYFFLKWVVVSIWMKFL